MPHLSHHQTPAKLGPCYDPNCSFSWMTGKLLVSCLRFLNTEVPRTICGCFSGKLWICPICRPSLSIITQEGTDTGSAVDISTIGETHNFWCRYGYVTSWRDNGHLTPDPRSVPPCSAAQFTHDKNCFFHTAQETHRLWALKSSCIGLWFIFCLVF